MDSVFLGVMTLIVVFSVPYATVVRMENSSLKHYLEFYKSQLRSSIERTDEVIGSLNEAIDGYNDLAERYRELCAAYRAAYEILEENDLLPEGSE